MTVYEKIRQRLGVETKAEFARMLGITKERYNHVSRSVVNMNVEVEERLFELSGMSHEEFQTLKFRLHGKARKEKRK